MKNRRLYVTIDTEMDADIHWKKRQPGEFTSVLYGIPKLLRPIWDRYDVYPIYFVSPEVVKDDGCCAALKAELSKGAVIGAHLHPEYIEPYTGKKLNRSQFPCFDCDVAIERQKLKNLTKLIEERLGVRPIWYRAARFGADRDSIQILQELGYQHDSSFTPKTDWSGRQGPDHSRTPLGPYRISLDDIYDGSERKRLTDITEHPVTILGKRWGLLGKLLPENWLFYRWLRPSHMTYLELKGVINEADRTGLKELVMMFHSMEIMINKTPYVRNWLMQTLFLKRLEKAIRYAKEKGYQS